MSTNQGPAGAVQCQTRAWQTPSHLQPSFEAPPCTPHQAAAHAVKQPDRSRMLCLLARALGRHRTLAALCAMALAVPNTVWCSLIRP